MFREQLQTEIQKKQQEIDNLMQAMIKAEKELGDLEFVLNVHDRATNLLMHHQAEERREHLHNQVMELLSVQ